MPNVYRIATPSATPVTGAAYASLVCASLPIQLHEVNIFLRTAVESEVSVGTPANTPVATSPLTPLNGRAGVPAATARLGTAWSTAPTAPTTFEDMKILAAVKGAGYFSKWAPDEYLNMQAASTRTWWNSGAGTAGQLLLSILYEE